MIQRQLATLFLQRTQSQIGNYIASRIGDQNATRIFQNLRNSGQVSPGQVFAETDKFAAWFASSKNAPRIYKNADGFCFTVTRKNIFSTVSFPVRPTNLIFDFGMMLFFFITLAISSTAAVPLALSSAPGANIYGLPEEYES